MSSGNDRRREARSTKGNAIGNGERFVGSIETVPEPSLLAERAKHDRGAAAARVCSTHPVCEDLDLEVGIFEAHVREGPFRGCVRLV